MTYKIIMSYLWSMKKERKLVIIAGITGAIGSAILSEYAQDNKNIIYGISRKGAPLDDFVINGKIPQKTLICDIGGINNYKKFFELIDFSNIDEVIYVHSLGFYPFEISNNGKISIQNDKNKDGINDETWDLTYKAYTNAINSLCSIWRGGTKTVIFGSLADKYEPEVHTSWWKTIKETKNYMKKMVKIKDNLSTIVFNISSVLCPHEIITRPFAFINTDTDQSKWLHPYELSNFVVKEIENCKAGFYEIEKYRSKDGFSPEKYYENNNFTKVKIKELFKQ